MHIGRYILQTQIIENPQKLKSQVSDFVNGNSYTYSSKMETGNSVMVIAIKLPCLSVGIQVLMSQ